MRYSDQPRDRIFVKGYGFLSFAKNISKNQRLLDHDKQSAADALKTASKRVIQKTVDATSDLKDRKLRLSKINITA